MMNGVHNSILEQEALKLLESGLIPIPINWNKEAAIKEWKQFQYRRPTLQEISEMFNGAYVKNIAVVCGQISKGLEVIDLDLKYDLTGTLKQRFCLRLKEELPDLVKRLVIAKTRNGGLHFFYRTRVNERSQKLARRPSTAAELAKNSKDKAKVLIETRAEGGLILVWPSIGYQFLRGNLQSIPEITDKEREKIMDICRSFNLLKEEPKIQHRQIVNRNYTDDPNSPLNDFDKRGDIIALLEKHGWTVVRENGEVTKLKRPGNSDSRDSGNFNYSLGWFSVFSTSTDFESETAYRPSAVYAELECGGDFTLAAKKLLAEGYGKSYIEQRREARRFKRRY